MTFPPEIGPDTMEDSTGFDNAVRVYRLGSLDALSSFVS